MDEPENVIDVAIGDRVAGMGPVPDHLGCLGGGEVTGEEVHLGARHHDLPQRGLAGIEDVVQDVSFLIAERRRGRHHRSQLLVGDVLTSCVGVAAQDPDEHVGGHTEEPDHWSERRRDTADHGGQGEGERLSPLHRQPLRGQFADDDGEVRDHHRDDDEGQGVGESRRHSPSHEHGGQMLGEHRGTERCREETGKGHADLDGREEQIGVLGESCDHSTAFAASCLELFDLGVPQAHQGDLGGSEDTADDDEDEDQNDVGRYVRHVSSPPALQAWDCRPPSRHGACAQQ